MSIRGRIIVAAIVAGLGAGTAAAEGPAVPPPRLAREFVPTSRPVREWSPTTQGAVRRVPAAASQAVGILPVAGQHPMLRVDSPKHDFGKIWDTDNIEHTFEMVNTGDRTVTITRVHSSCGCTTADKWAKQVGPGETWELVVKLDPKGRRGKTSKTITVDTDDPGARQVVFLMEGEIQPRLNMTQSVNFGTLREDSAVKRTITITNNSDEPINLTGAKADLNLLKVDLREIEPGRKYELDVETVPPLNMRSIRGKITLQTDLKEQPEVAIYAYAHIQPRVSLMPQMVMVQQPLTQEFRRRLVLKTMEGVKIQVKEAKASNPDIAVKVDAVREGQEYNVWLEMKPGLTLAPAGETVTITTNDEQVPTLTVSVRSFVAPRLRAPLTSGTVADPLPQTVPTSQPAMQMAAPASQGQGS